MSAVGKTPNHIELNEPNHVEIPLLEQFDGLVWDIIDLTDKKQLLADTGHVNRVGYFEIVRCSLIPSSTVSSKLREHERPNMANGGITPIQQLTLAA